MTDERFDVLDKKNARAAEYLGKVPRKLFVTAYCPDHIAMYSLKCSNLAESKNYVLLPAQSELALGFLDKSLEHLMGQVNKIRIETQKWDSGQVLTPYAEALYLVQDTEAARCSAQESGAGLYYVAYTASQNAHRRTVRLDDKWCSCLYWQQNGIPCCHAIKAAQVDGCLSNMMEWYKHSVEPCFHAATMKAAFVNAHVELPILDRLIADGSTKPAKWQKKPGRPRKKRIRGKGGKDGVVPRIRKCTHCGEAGHYAQRCMRPPPGLVAA
jgi:hypothetical protein